jgi:sugar lactone lactonase YvrE
MNQPPLDAELVVDLPCALGEGPCWDEASGSLLWVDIEGARIHRLRDDGAVCTIQLTEKVGAVAPRAAGGMIAAVAGGFVLLERDGALERSIPVEADRPDTRMNDARVDRLGRFWAGTTHLEFLPGAGSLYRLDPDGSIEQVLDGLALSNGLDWSPDNQLMYFIDTLTFRVDVFDFDEAGGLPRDRRAFVALPEGEVLPDGLTVDAEGNVWVAFWGGGAVKAWDPSGAQIAEVRLPVPRVTSCAFGGIELDRLYVTTARGSDPPHPPPAGGVFAATPGPRGRPRTPFGG